MQWEYLFAEVEDGDIIRVNGKPTTQWEGGFFSGKLKGEKPEYREFFNKVGAEGWELVSFSRTSLDHIREAVFRRPLEKIKS